MSSKTAAYGWAPGKENYRPIKRLFDCALYKINLRVTCHRCGHSKVIDAPGHWWRCERQGLDDSIAALGKKLYCSSCFQNRQVKVRNLAIAQTNDKADGLLLPGPGEYEWKRIVSKQRG